jgi:PP-loop superfamily ATP-utilizing enzyme
VSADPRVARAEVVLLEHGFPGGTVSVEGHEGEIAAIRVSSADWERLVCDDTTVLCRELKALGFRYVAVDLLPAGE